jgi:hypothetical protein
MSKFMLVFRGGGFATAGVTPTELQAHLTKWRSWLDALAKSGHSRDGGTPLQNPGKTLRGRQRIVTDGPFAESKDMITGSLIVEAKSLDEAAGLARECPVFEYDGSVEVRPLLSLDT